MFLVLFVKNMLFYSRYLSLPRPIRPIYPYGGRARLNLVEFRDARAP